MTPLILLALATAVFANIDVQVGLNGQLRFSPEIVHGNPGELVNFHFHGSTHSVTESTARLNDPCHPLGGFDTGIQKDGAVQSIVISTHNSIYVHCTPHCGQGMVMIVNPGPKDNIETFRKAAIAQEGGGGGSTQKPTSSTTSTSNTTSTSKPRPSTSKASTTGAASQSSSTTTNSASNSSSASIVAPSLPLSTLSTLSGSSNVSTIPTATSPSGSASQTSGSATTGGAVTTSSGAATELIPNGFTPFAMFLSSLFAIAF